MNRLEKHIEILLLSNDCVMVPGLGGFMAYHQCAKYSEDDCQILPPLRTLGFNPKLKANDNLLVQSYMEAFDISFPEAVQKIEDEVGKINNYLTNHGDYIFNGIGTLSVNKDGNFDFVPIKSGLLTPNLYAFDTVQIKKLYELQLVKVKNNSKAKISNENENIIDVNIGENCNLPVNAHKGDYINIKLSAIRNLAAIIIALVGFFLFTSPLSTSNLEMGVGKINTDMLYEIMPKAMVTDGGENIIPIVLKREKPYMTKPSEKEETTFKVKKNNKQDINKVNSEKKYCIVMASQVSKANGDTFLAVVHKQGLVSARMIGDGNKRKIVYGDFASETEAYKELNKLHANKYFTQAWVYEIK